MGKKAVEMGRYGVSELMRNKNLQKKAVNYGISKLTPFIQDSVGTAMEARSGPYSSSRYFLQISVSLHKNL